VIPVLANHGENSPPGSVIYIVKDQDKKIIMGWDFLSLPNVDENLLSRIVLIELYWRLLCFVMKNKVVSSLLHLDL
jgi:hypothetical protein